MQDELKNLGDKITANEKKTDVLYERFDGLEKRIEKIEKGGKG